MRFTNKMLKVFFTIFHVQMSHFITFGGLAVSWEQRSSIWFLTWIDIELRYTLICLHLHSAHYCDSEKWFWCRHTKRTITRLHLFFCKLPDITVKCIFYKEFYKKKCVWFSTLLNYCRMGCVVYTTPYIFRPSSQTRTFN